MNILEAYAQAYSESLQQTIDAQKKELTEKDQVINEKDQEILKLKEKLAALEAKKTQS